jgi:hypothetical protein
MARCVEAMHYGGIFAVGKLEYLVDLGTLYIVHYFRLCSISGRLSTYMDYLVSDEVDPARNVHRVLSLLLCRTRSLTSNHNREILAPISVPRLSAPPKPDAALDGAIFVAIYVANFVAVSVLVLATIEAVGQAVGHEGILVVVFWSTRTKEEGVCRLG